MTNEEALERDELLAIHNLLERRIARMLDDGKRDHMRLDRTQWVLDDIEQELGRIYASEATSD